MNYFNPSYYGSSQYMSQQLNGKIVDSEEMVKATEVPIGGYGIFPKADFSEIYLKTWNGNGTISIIRFIPFMEEPKEDPVKMLAERVEALENKIKAAQQQVDYKEVF